MSRISQTLLVFSTQTVTSADYVWSEPIDVSRSAYSTFELAFAAGGSGAFVAVSSNIVASSNRDGSYVQINDNAGTRLGYIGMTQGSTANSITSFAIPMVNWIKIGMKQSSDNTITVEHAKLTLDELNA